MFANYLIGLREGIEAALVVSILIAYLVKTERRSAILPVWIGVGLAIALSLAFGAALTFTSSTMSFQAQEAFGGFMSIIAVCFVTWMIFWMKRTARNIKGELHGRLDSAFGIGPVAIAVVAFIAVAREGLETSLFIWAAVQSTGSGTAPVLGATLGLATAVLLGWLFYRGALKINLAKFFTITGAALVVVAAGVLAYAVHDLQEAGILPGLDNTAFDATGAIPPSSWYGTLIKGIFNLSAAPSWLELIVWVAYLIPVMYLFFRKPRSKPDAPVAQAPVTTTATSA
ncbi:MAG: FTR1 family protein [Candidatus Nanopelagicales bacterium]|nr:FTR1 family protein [Candidatus Nanopelagicales bacterium]